MNLLGLLDYPSSGALTFRGTNTTTLSADGQARLRNRHIGFIFQAYHLMPRRTACGNVELPLAYRGVLRRERRRRAEAALAKVGLSARLTAYPPEMSGGEQQRVAIARALVTDPHLIVADEPTGALDTATSNQILELLEAACTKGRTVLLVTHDPAVAMRATRSIHIRDGRIMRDGPAALGMRDPVSPSPLSPEAVS